jgi:hypothetical protein
MNNLSIEQLETNHAKLFSFEREKFIKHIHGFIAAWDELRQIYGKSEFKKLKITNVETLSDQQLIKIHKFFIDKL